MRRITSTILAYMQYLLYNLLLPTTTYTILDVPTQYTCTHVHVYTYTIANTLSQSTIFFSFLIIFLAFFSLSLNSAADEKSRKTSVYTMRNFLSVRGWFSRFDSEHCEKIRSPVGSCERSRPHVALPLGWLHESPIVCRCRIHRPTGLRTNYSLRIYDRADRPK